jgi:very-short-patch-repair endonuclease
MRRIDPEMTRRARALRTDATKAERTLWRLLSRFRPKFTRQLVADPFILDLACREARLAVEVDGGQHADNAADERRTRWLESEGWTVIRFWNSEVAENPAGVAEAILLRAAECLGGTHPQPLPSREGRERRPRLR